MADLKNPPPKWAENGTNLEIIDDYTAVTPLTASTTPLGTTGLRWSNVNSVNGDFSGDIAMDDASTLEIGTDLTKTKMDENEPKY